MKRSTIVNQVREHLSSSLFKNTYVLMAMRLFGGFGGFLFWALAARMMVASDLGLATTLAAAGTLLAGLGQLGLGYALVRHLPHTDDPHRVVNVAITVTTLVLAVMAVVFLVGLPVFSPALLPVHSSTEAMVSFVLLTVSTGLSQLLNWAFLARRVPIYSLIKNALQVFISVVLLVVFVLRGESNYLMGVHSYMLGTLISLLISVIFFLPKSEPGYRFRPVLPTGGIRGGFTGYALSNYAADQLARIGGTLLPLLVANVLGLTQAGYFNVVWQLATGFGSMDEAASSSFFAEGSNDPHKMADYLPQSLKMTLVISSVVAVGAIAISRFVLLIYGRDYVVNGNLPLIIDCLALVPAAITPIYFTILRVRDRMLELVLVSALDVATAIAFTYLFMVWYGLVGSAVGWLVSRLVILVLIAPIWRRQSSHLVPAKDILDEHALG